MSTAEPAVSAHRKATAMPATRSRPKPRTIGTGESSRTRNPVAVASAAVAMAGADCAAACATARPADRGSPPARAAFTRASWARAWNWMP